MYDIFTYIHKNLKNYMEPEKKPVEKESHLATINFWLPYASTLGVCNPIDQLSREILCM